MKGIDVSYWQGAIDWAKVKAAGYEFAAVRATVGDYYTDPNFVSNVKGAKAAGLIVGGYFVLAPKTADLTRVITAGQHLDKFRAAVGWLGDVTLDFVALDCELNRGMTAAEITPLIRDILAGLAYKRTMIYTRQSWWNTYVTRSAEWSMYPLWVANYVTEPVGEPSIPADWASATIWQWTNLGAVDGVPSGNCDKDVFVPGRDAALEYFGLVQDPLAALTAQVAALTRQVAEFQPLLDAMRRDQADNARAIYALQTRTTAVENLQAETAQRVAVVQAKADTLNTGLANLDQRMATGGKALAG